MSSVRDQPQIRRYKNCIEFSYRFYRWRRGKGSEFNMVTTYKTENKTPPSSCDLYVVMTSSSPSSCTTQQSQTYNEAYDKQNSDTILYTNITFHLADDEVQSKPQVTCHDVMQYQPSSCCLLYFSSLPWCSKDVRTTENLRHKLQNKWSISLLIHRKILIDSINEAVFYHQTGILEWQLVVQHVNCLFVLMGKRLKVSLAQLCAEFEMYYPHCNVNHWLL